MEDGVCETKLVLDKKGHLVPRCFHNETEAKDWDKVYHCECAYVGGSEGCCKTNKCPPSP